MRKTSFKIGLVAAAVLGGAPIAGALAQPPVSQQHFAAEAVAQEATRFAEAWEEKPGSLGVYSSHTVSAIKNPSTVVNLRELREEAAWGNADAEAALGLYHLTSRDAGYDPKAAFAYNISAAEAGVPVAQTNVGLQFLNGVGTTRDTSKAAVWFEVAAKRGHTDAAYQTGVMYLQGEGVAEDSLMARYWLLRAKEAGDRRAARLLDNFATF